MLDMLQVTWGSTKPRRGQTWSPVNTGLTLSQLYVHSVAVDPEDGNRISRGTLGVDADEQKRRAVVEDLSSGLPVIFVEPLVVNGGFLYAATLGSGIYRTALH